MGKGIRQLKAGNSKSTLVKAIMMYQKALLYYTKDSHWAVSAEGIYKWVGEDNPMLVARTVLGMEKKDTAVREPDKTPGWERQEKSGADDSIHLLGGK